MLSKCEERLLILLLFLDIPSLCSHCVQSGSLIIVCQHVISSFSPPLPIASHLLCLNPYLLLSILRHIYKHEQYPGSSDRTSKSRYIDAKKGILSSKSQNLLRIKAQQMWLLILNVFDWLSLVFYETLNV